MLPKLPKSFNPLSRISVFLTRRYCNTKVLKEAGFNPLSRISVFLTIQLDAAMGAGDRNRFNPLSRISVFLTYVDASDGIAQ